MTNEDAYQAVLGHHRELRGQVEKLTLAVQRAVNDSRPVEPAVADLTTYVGTDVLPHAHAEEKTIYRVAAERARLAPTVSDMIDEHRRLESMAQELATERSGDRAVVRALDLSRLFATHVAKENNDLLPPLVADDEVDLPELVEEMHRIITAA
jgi:hemerythrin-like domain-containing protein